MRKHWGPFINDLRQIVLKSCWHGGGGCQKSGKIADVVYAWSLVGYLCLQSKPSLYVSPLIQSFLPPNFSNLCLVWMSWATNILSSYFSLIRLCIKPILWASLKKKMFIFFIFWFNWDLIITWKNQFLVWSDSRNSQYQTNQTDNRNQTLLQIQPGSLDPGWFFPSVPW